VLFGLGAILLVAAGLACWRASRAASRSASALSAYALEEASALQALAVRLNEHGFTLQHTSAELSPKLSELGGFLERPLVAASLPWLLRRLFGRPLKRRR
jgi:hypothetical protein